MAEFEELRLQVSLVDNASAGLARLNEQIKQLGGSQTTQGLDRFRRQGQEIGGMLGGLGESAAGASNRMAMLARGLSLAGGAITTIGLAAKSEYDSIVKFSTEMLRLGAVANQTGQSAAQIRSMADALRRSGVDQQAATRTIAGLSDAMADLGRTNSRIRQEMLRGLMTTEQRQDIEQFLATLTRAAESNDIAKFGNTVKEALDNVYRIGIQQGLSPARAAEARRRMAAMFGGEELIELQRRFQHVSAEQRRVEEERIKAAREFWRLTEGIWQNLQAISRANVAEWLTDTSALEWLEKAERLTRHIADNWARWKREGRETLQRQFETNEPIFPGGQSALDWLLGRDPNRAPVQKSPAKPLRFAPAGSDLLEGMPESTNVEDRRNENKYLSENTAELKRLNDYLTGVTKGGIGGGPINIPQKFFGGGGGGSGGLGIGAGTGGGDLGGRLGLPDVAGGGAGAGAGAGGGVGGGGGGAGAPYGSQVGPGTGAGAGSTPATGNTQVETGGGGRGGPGGAGLRGSAGQNAQRMYDTLRGLGHSHQQASAALAHARAESSFDPNTVGDRGTAFGMLQMRGERWTNQQRMAREWGLDPRSPEATARFLDWELRNDPRNAGRGVGERYFGAQSTREAVTALNAYERFKGWQQGQPQRYRFGEQFERTMRPSSEGGATAGTAEGETGGGSTSMNGIRMTPGANGRTTITTGSGARFTVASEFAPNFAGFLSDYQAAGGVISKQHAGSWNVRNIAGTNRPSLHSFGRAIDINITGRNRFAPGLTGLPGGAAQEEEIARRHGLSAGSTWRNPDRGHFEVASPETARRAQMAHPFLGARQPQPDRAQIDGMMGHEIQHSVTGTGQIDVNVRAPRGTSVAAKAGGLFKRVAMNRQRQMEVAASGAPEPTSSMEE